MMLGGGGECGVNLRVLTKICMIAVLGGSWSYCLVVCDDLWWSVCKWKCLLVFVWSVEGQVVVGRRARSYGISRVADDGASVSCADHGRLPPPSIADSPLTHYLSRLK